MKKVLFTLSLAICLLLSGTAKGVDIKVYSYVKSATIAITYSNTYSGGSAIGVKTTPQPVNFSGPHEFDCCKTGLYSFTILSGYDTMKIKITSNGQEQEQTFYPLLLYPVLIFFDFTNCF